MKILQVTLIVVVLFLGLTILLHGDSCEIYATCPYDGTSSMQTGNAKYTPKGCMVREYGHPASFDGKTPAHKFWEACECE